MVAKKKLGMVQTKIAQRSLVTVNAKAAAALATAGEKKVSSLVAAAQKIVVKDDEGYKAAAQFVADLKGEKKRLDAERKTITDPLDQAKKATMGIYNPMTKTLDEMVGLVDRKLIGYLEEKAAEAQKAVAKEAKALEKKGMGDMANDLRKEAAREAIPEVSGTTIRSSWSAECMDMVMLLEAIQKGDAPRDFVCFNEKYANGIARLVKDAKKAPPGVRYTEEKYTQSGGFTGEVA